MKLELIMRIWVSCLNSLRLNKDIVFCNFDVIMMTLLRHKYFGGWGAPPQLNFQSLIRKST